MVSVNYDLNDYLPEDATSTLALEKMQEEFDGEIPNARIMMTNVSIAEALAYKEQLESIDGVLAVTWLDDAVNIKQPLQMQDTNTVETYYKDGNALFSITIDEEKNLETVSALQDFIREEDALTGSAVSTAVATVSTIKEIKTIAIIAVVLILLILTLTTNSWLEPIVILLGLGVAIVINAGSNIIFGEISFVTNAAGSILQLAVSLDYYVFLVHRFNECRKTMEPENAMLEALCKSTSSIFSSGLTTVIGFLALVLMRFRIGADLGLALGKGIAISLIMVFLFMPGLLLSTYKITDCAGHRPLLPTFRRFGKGIRKMMLPAAALLVLIMVPSYLASTSNSYYYGSAYIFGEDTELGADTKAIEEVFGKSDSYVLLVPKGDLEAEEALVEEIKEIDKVSSVIAYVEQAGAQIPYEYVDDSILEQLESENYSRIVLSVKEDADGEDAFALVKRIRKIAKSYYDDTYYLAGAGVSTCDLMTTVTSDMVKVNAIAVGAVFLVLVLSMRSLKLPVVLVLTIETAIWFNLSLPYYSDTTLFYIAYLIISSIQLGATVDYAILFTDRYQENRRQFDRKESIVETVSQVTGSILTSGLALTIVGFLLGKISTHGLLSQLGYLLGKGTICSLAAVFFALPGFLYILDGIANRKKKEAGQKNAGKRSGKHKCAAMMLAFSITTVSCAMPVAAAEEPSKKEEVVYAMLKEDGTVDGIYVVNSFTDKSIIDYGDYETVKNLTTTDAITKAEDKITIQTGADKIYYQGDLATKDIPWNIAIEYTLDGEPIEASQLAGSTGALKIKMAITENKNCDASFFKGYALQITASTQIKNGIYSVAAGLETVDNSIIQYQNSLAQAGLTDINDYVEKHKQVLNNISISQTQAALYEAYENGGDKAVMQKLAALVQQKDSEALSLYQQYQTANQDSSVITTYIKNAGTAIAMKTLIESDIAYIQGSNQLISGIDSALDSKTGELRCGVLTLQNSYQEFDKNIQSMVKSLTKLSKSMNKLKKGIHTLDTNSQKWNKGVKSYTNAVREITKGYKSIYEGTKNLTAGTADLYEGTKEFYEETATMDTDVSDMIDDTITEMTGADVETISFVSNKNTNVESVLFVMKTPEIKIAEIKEQAVEQKSERGFWEKVKRLFKR